MIKYDRLWKTLEGKNISGNALHTKYGVSKGQIYRLKKNMNVSTNTLNRLCALLQCDLTDIVEYQFDPSDLDNFQRQK
ncbi:MAG: helix-turn-helix transcriptional regulator [Solobacterium sp.]|nr:helix-turn-helix transcriptional regulator [Solobacterium sp.]